VTNVRAGSAVALLLGVGLALALGACGDDDSVAPPPTAATPAPTPAPTPTPATVVLQGQQGLQAPANPNGGTNLVAWDFTTPADGTVDVTITYVHASSRILVWVTDRPCTQWQFERDECNYLTASSSGSSPRKLTATGVKAGKYSLIVANDGPNDEQIGYLVTLR
jgi:hypothetical protein